MGYNCKYESFALAFASLLDYGTGFRVTTFRFSLLSLALFGATPTAFSAESLNDATSGDTTLEQVVVTGTVDPVAASATGLALTLKETPQSVTVVEQDLIEALSLTNVNDLLDRVPGINVERNETDRTMYDARGFDITNFQLRGWSLAHTWTSLICTLFLLAICVTGLPLIFSSEIDRLGDEAPSPRRRFTRYIGRTISLPPS